MVALKGTASEPQETTCYGTRWLEERPIIFKTNRRQAFSGKASFEAGFGCTIADAVIGSCSAYPFFEKKFVLTGHGERIEVRDGGFVANNPALFAIVDATESLGFPRTDVRVVSIGVGEYPKLHGVIRCRFKRTVSHEDAAFIELGYVVEEVL